jgi:hypothetical protein
MENILKPTKEDLQPLLNVACADQTVAQWKGKFLESMKKMLRKQPLRYRGYGPYWWLIKKMFIDQGVLDFGEDIDRQWFDSVDYGDDTVNLVAAFAYEDARFATVNIYEGIHTMETDTGTIDYLSSDEDMEIMGKK